MRSIVGTGTRAARRALTNPDACGGVTAWLAPLPFVAGPSGSVGASLLSGRGVTTVAGVSRRTGGGFLSSIAAPWTGARRHRR